MEIGLRSRRLLRNILSVGPGRALTRLRGVVPAYAEVSGGDSAGLVLKWSRMHFSRRAPKNGISSNNKIPILVVQYIIIII